MNRDLVMKYLNSSCAKEEDFRVVLEQFKQKNKDFIVECLLQLKSGNLDQLEQILNDEYQLKAMLTDVLNDLGDRDHFFYQICSYVTTWNLINKILEFEDEKESINKDIQTILVSEPAAREILIYLYNNPRAKDSSVNKALKYSYHGAVVNALTALCDKDIVYKTAIKKEAFYDLTENGRAWIEKNIDIVTKDLLPFETIVPTRSKYIVPIVFTGGTCVGTAAMQCTSKYKLDGLFLKDSFVCCLGDKVKYDFVNKIRSKFNYKKEDDTLEQDALAGLPKHVK